MSDPPLRLSGTSYAVLSLLALVGEATPYDLKRLLERSIENFWPVPHTTFYAEPERLAKAGLLSKRHEQEGRRRKVYSLTDRGREALREWREAPDFAPPQLRDEGLLKLFSGADATPYLRARREWYRAKRQELEGYLEACPEGEAWQGVRASLLVGINYSRLLAEAIDEFFATQAASTGS